jgi:hypothetical protein
MGSIFPAISILVRDAIALCNGAGRRGLLVGRIVFGYLTASASSISF